MFIRGKKNKRTDTDLLADYQNHHDLNTLSELFNRYTSLVYGVCLKYLKHREDAQDCVMDIYEKMISTLKYHHISNFKSWLYVTARNECLMQLRARKGKPEEFTGEFMENVTLPHHEEELDLENNLTKMEKCIDKLSLEQQICLRLFFLKEKCYQEVAASTGFNFKKVKSVIQNGKRNLKICMDKNE